MAKACNEQAAAFKEEIAKLHRDLDAKHEEVQEMRGLADYLNEQIFGLKREKDKLMEDLETELQGRSEFARRFDNRIAELESEKAKQAQEMQQKTEQCAQLPPQLLSLQYDKVAVERTIVEMTSNAELLEARIATLSEEKDCVSRTSAAKMAILAEEKQTLSQSYQNHIRRLQGENNQLTGENANLHRKVADSQSCVASLQTVNSQQAEKLQLAHQQAAIWYGKFLSRSRQAEQAAFNQSQAAQGELHQPQQNDPEYVEKWGPPLSPVRLRQPPNPDVLAPFHTAHPGFWNGSPHQAHAGVPITDNSYATPPGNGGNPHQLPSGTWTCCF